MKFIRLLKHEIAQEAQQWVEQGIITKDQGNEILSFYGTTLPDGRGKSFAYFALNALAALFTGVAAILIVSHNWEDIPRALRMLSLIGLTIAFNGIGLSYFQKGRTKASEIWFLVASFLYGASIFLIAQIYHLGEYFPNGVLFWALGVLPLALIVESTVLMALVSGLSAVWFCLEVQNGYVPWMMLLFSGSFLWFSLLKKRSIIIFLSGVLGLIALAEAIIARFFSGEVHIFAMNANHVFFTAGIFLLLYTLGNWLEKKRISEALTDYGVVLCLWSMRFGVIMLFVFSFEESWEGLLEWDRVDFGFVMFWMLAVLAGQWLLLQQGSSSAEDLPKKFFSVDNLPAILFTLAFSLATTLIWLSSGNESLALPFQVLTNLGLLSMGIWSITRAFRTSAGSSFYFGVGIILATALLRYIDLVGDYIGGALLFFIAAMIMFASARVWHHYSSIGRTEA